MNVQLPDGTVIQDVPEGTSRDQLATKLKAKGFNVPDAWMSNAPKTSLTDPSIPQPATFKPGKAASAKPDGSWFDKLGRVIVGLPEAGASVATGMAGSLASIPTALVAGPEKAAQVEQAMTYQPRFGPGKENVQAFSDFMREAKLEGAAPEFSRLGAAGSSGRTGAIPKPPKYAKDSPKVTIPQELVEKGIKIPPSMTNPDSKVGSVLGAISGKIQTQQKASALNQETFNRLAAQDLGLAEGTPILKANLDPIRENYGKIVKEIIGKEKALPEKSSAMSGAYGSKPTPRTWRADDQLRNASERIWSDKMTIAQQEGKALPKEFTELKKVLDQGNMPPSYAMPKIKALRADATESFRKGDFQLGAAQKATADAMEDFMERRISDLGDPDLLDRFRTARQLTAKTYDYEAAANELGDISASKMAKIAGDKPLSGNAKSIAQAGSLYPKASQQLGAMGGYQPHSALSMGAGAMELGQGNYGTALEILAGRPLARGILMSDWGQRRFTIPQAGPRAPSTFQQALEMARQNPWMIPAPPGDSQQ